MSGLGRVLIFRSGRACLRAVFWNVLLYLRFAVANFDEQDLDARKVK